MSLSPVLSFIAVTAGAASGPAPAHYIVDMTGSPEPSVSPYELDDWLETAAGLSPDDATEVTVSVRLPGGALVPAESLLPTAAPPPPPPPSRGIDNPGESTGFLSGKTVYLSQCHGWIWYASLGRFSTQRGNLYDTVEDFHNPEGADAFLVRYLENAGARVVTLRERDHNPNGVIVDNTDAGYAESGAGFADGAAGYGRKSSWAFGENPFDEGTTRTFPADSTARATFRPTIPADGEYGVYISYDADAAHDPAAVVRLTHPGGTIERALNQTSHGSTWVYLETLWLPAGSGSLEVEVAGSGATGRRVSVDAVRVGGGMGDVTRYGVTTGRPRWEEGAVLNTQYNGAPPSVYDPYDEGDGSDPSARSRYAAWRHPAGEDAIYLSWHSNAGGGTGTSTYTYEGSSGPAVAGSEDLGGRVQEEIVNAVRALWDGDWTDRGNRTAAFSEVSPYHNNEMPAALVELAFHDHSGDVYLLKDPVFRRDAARAMTRGIVRYFADRDGVSPDFLPEPPASVSLLHEGNALVARWSDGPAGDPFGDSATGWRVYTSADGRSWDNGVDVTSRSLELGTRPGDTVYIRVTATNSGGESFPSEVVGARRMPAGQLPPVLVVAAFDRLDIGQLIWEDVPVLGDLKRMTSESRLNPRDLVARQGRSISGAGWYFDSVSDDLLDSVDMDAYPVVVWIAGEESTADEALSDAQQARLRDHWSGGGSLWVSGSEVLWDLDYLGTSTDKAFAEEVLGATMAADDADTWTAEGVDLLAGLTLDFSEEGGAPYHNEYPDVLGSDRTVIAEYAPGQPAAILGERVAHFGFPVDCIGDESTREEVALRVLDALLPGWEAPELTAPGDTGSTDSDPSDPDRPGGIAEDSGQLGPQGSPGDAVALSKLGGCACSSTARRGPSTAWFGLLLLGAFFRRRDSPGSAAAQADPTTHA